MSSPASPRVRAARRVNPPRSASGLGIDLAIWHADVRRLVIGLHGRRIRAAGLDPDEVLSEVYRRILVANTGRSAYDPTRASMSRYVSIQAASAISNMVEARELRQQHERLGLAADASAAASARGTSRPGREVDGEGIALLECTSGDARTAALEWGRTDAERLGLALLAEGASDEVIERRTGLRALELLTLAAEAALDVASRRRPGVRSGITWEDPP